MKKADEHFTVSFTFSSSVLVFHYPLYCYLCFATRNRFPQVTFKPEDIYQHKSITKTFENDQKSCNTL